MNIYGIDPGPLHSALAVIDYEDPRDVKYMAWRPNCDIEEYLRWELTTSDILGIEWIANYGRVVGEETFKTAFTAGRFSMIGELASIKRFEIATRPKINLHFCGKGNVKKPHTRQALLDRWGGSVAKKKGEPLSGVSNHIWDALAVAVYMKEVVC